MGATSTSHPLFARIYPRVARAVEARGGSEHRRALLAGLAGAVIEIGAGNGLNFAHYPASVSRVTAVEPEPRLRALAERAASAAPVPVRVLDGVAQALPAGDGEFEAAVFSLVLCSVPDQRLALAEARRVLIPGGELRFYEHVRSADARRARIQRLLDASIYPTLAAGCHCSRDTVGAIEQAGFEVVSLERAAIRGEGPRPLLPHVLGLARRL
ncbi:MAG TPA: class I SAM-dependent methyltransferase [Solirubrobacteraceae bacterium]|nr:class I SAM-dependent methyltransferase [Solirubrobacteraceae bacterium]